jgi:N-acetylglucosaminyldiphosphoundecaprenol N-acetyl-beta-D-mannosaminyltransferase
MVHTPRKHTIVRVGISATSYGEVAKTCRDWLDERDSGNDIWPAARYICATSVHGIVTAHHDPEVRRYLNGADIATPDGMPVVWALRSCGVSGQQRVYGPTLMLGLCEMAAGTGRSVFLYGSSPQTLAALERNLRSRFGSLRIAGTYSPPFRPLSEEERLDIVRRIAASKADFVFIGLSTPKQERWMAQNRRDLPGQILVGVGAAFDFHAGSLRQAPPWMQRSGLEWLFRLLMEPRRLWRRYLLETPTFLPLWGLQMLGVRRLSQLDLEP